jgi:CheY-like chemotaxis protein
VSTILLVDDEPDILALYSEVLELRDCRVLRARDGVEALAVARARRPDLVVTDCQMPRMTGSELSRRLHEDPRLRDVPVLMHSSSRNPHAPGVWRFLPKSAELSEFEAAVDALLAAPPPAARPPEPEAEPEAPAWAPAA